MKKQVQYASFILSEGQAMDAEIRAQIEEPLNHGWSIQGWESHRSVDLNNQPAFFIVICLTRELEEAAAEPEVVMAAPVKRGRPKKNA